MEKYKYPVGTRIKYIGFVEEDFGKAGKIVGWKTDSIVYIVVPNSYVALKHYNNPLHSWTTYVENIEVLVVKKGQQLEFDFMNE